MFNKNNKKTTWEFKCVNYDQAKVWAKKIESSQKEMIDLNNSNAYPAQSIEVDRYKLEEPQTAKLYEEPKVEPNTGVNIGVNTVPNNGNRGSNAEQSKELGDAARNS